MDCETKADTWMFVKTILRIFDVGKQLIFTFEFFESKEVLITDRPNRLKLCLHCGLDLTSLSWDQCNNGAIVSCISTLLIIFFVLISALFGLLGFLGIFILAVSRLEVQRRKNVLRHIVLVGVIINFGILSVGQEVIHPV
jgi:hypothetical protein